MLSLNFAFKGSLEYVKQIYATKDAIIVCHYWGSVSINIPNVVIK